MKKFTKKLIALCSLLALSVSLTAEASANTVLGNCSGVSFTGSIRMTDSSTCTGYTSINRSPIYGDRKRIGINANYKESTSSTENIVRLTIGGIIGEVSGFHTVWVNGNQASVSTEC